MGVIGVITLITLSVTIIFIIMILANPILRTCRQQQPTTNDAEVQEDHLPYLLQLPGHDRSPYILPEPELFTSESHINQSLDKEDKQGLPNFLRSPVDKCITMINPKGKLNGRIQIAPKPETCAINEGSNSWNFGGRNRDTNETFY